MGRFRSNAKGRSSSFGLYCGWFLAALLILFCSSARRGPFLAHNTSLRPIDRAVLVENTAASLVLVFLSWWLASINARLRIDLTPSAFIGTVSPFASAGGFDRDLRIRPPPRF